MRGAFFQRRARPAIDTQKAFEELRSGQRVSPETVAALQAASIRSPEVDELRELVRARRISYPAITSEIVDSYRLRKDGAISLEVPAHVSDTLAIEALNESFRWAWPHEYRKAVFEPHIPWFERLDSVKSRDITKPRHIVLVPVVAGTEGKSCIEQAAILEHLGMRFANPIEQILVAVVHAHIHQGSDLFRGYRVRGSMPGHTLINICKPRQGLRVSVYGEHLGNLEIPVAASGVPTSQQVPHPQGLKKLRAYFTKR